MSDQIPQGDFSPGFDGPASGRGLDGRALRALIAGAAGVAVLGAFTGGFLWLNSSPSGDTASAVTPGVSSNATPTGSATTTGGAFAFGGRDAFDGSFLPVEVAAGGTSEGTSGGSAAGGSTSGGSGASGTRTSGATAPSGTVVTGSSSAAPTTAPTTGKPVAPGGGAVATPPVIAPPVPSAAPSWQKGSVTFDKMVEDSSAGWFVFGAGGVDPVKYAVLADTVLPSTSTVYRPQGTTSERSLSQEEKTECEAFVKTATAEEAEAKNRATENCTVALDFVYVPVLVPSSQTGAAKGDEAFGWIAADDAAIPDAALGRVTNTLRWIGTRGDSYGIQIGNGTPQWVEEGDAVEGAVVGDVTLKFEGTSIDAIDRQGVAVFSDGKNKYFTIIGAGEGSGVTF